MTTSAAQAQNQPTTPPTPPTASAIPAARDGGEGAFYTKVYDRLYRLGYHAKTDYSHAHGLCEQILARCQFESVLDVGCSNGWAVGHLSKLGKRALGVDISPTAVEKGKALGRDLRVGSATRLPIADGEVDVVMSTDCFEHLRPQDVHLAIDEAVRVSKRFIALKINPRPDRNTWWKLLAGTNLHLTLMPMDIWIQQFERRGCRVVWQDAELEEFIMEKAAS